VTKLEEQQVLGESISCRRWKRRRKEIKQQILFRFGSNKGRRRKFINIQ
jgi:hypothetical protein